jgi:hypothetical protein
LYFLPLPQGQRSLRPIFFPVRIMVPPGTRRELVEKTGLVADPIFALKMWLEFKSKSMAFFCRSPGRHSQWARAVSPCPPPPGGHFPRRGVAGLISYS